MATDIAGSVTPEYTAAINVPSDGDATNGAGLVTMALPLANRIEFIQNQLNTAPWIKARVDEDFLFVHRESGGSGILRADGPWELDEDITDTYAFTNVASDGPEVGVCQISQSSGNTADLLMRKPIGMRLVQVERLAFRIKFNAILADQSVEIGFGDGTNPQLSPPGSSDIFAVNLRCVDSGSWVLHTKDTTDSEVAIPGSTMVAGTFMHLELVHDGAGGWTASADGGTTAAAVATIPAGTTDVGLLMRYATPAAGTRSVELDFISCSFLSASRVL